MSTCRRQCHHVDDNEDVNDYDNEGLKIFFNLFHPNFFQLVPFQLLPIGS